MGMCLSQELREKVLLLEELKRCFLMLQGDIRFTVATFPEALAALSARAKPPYADCFAAIGKRMESEPQLGLAALWEQEFSRALTQTPFSEEEIQYMMQLGSDLGYLDKEMQLGTIGQILQQLKEREAAAKTFWKDKSVVYRTVGTMGGVLITLLLL